jgi:hypothetical protein
VVKNGGEGKMIIKDKIALGTMVGMIASIPQILINVLAMQTGFAQHYAFQYAASIYVYKNLTYTFWGLLFGWLVWESMAAGLGVITTYLIYWTGKDYWWLKGLLISNTVMFIFLYGFFFGLEAPKIVPWDLETNWTLFIENLAFGITAGYLTVRLGVSERK